MRVFEICLREERSEEGIFKPVLASWEPKIIGAYYTPFEVIDYILSVTLRDALNRIWREFRELLDEGDVKGAVRKIEEVSKLKIVDPACGSGLFLMRAFDMIERYYLRFCRVVKTSLNLVKEIFRNNLYGIDIDQRAIRSAFKNLIFNALEAETGGEIEEEEIKSFLLRNLQAGNALVSGDREKLSRYFSENLEAEKPFDWEEVFPEVFRDARRGFDFVLGNPPWISFGLRGTQKISKSFARYFRDNYWSMEYKGSFYALFIELGIRLLKEGGKLGFIVPDSFLLGRYFSKLRRFILDNTKIKEIVLILKDFWPKSSSGRNVIIVLEKASEQSLEKKKERNNNTVFVKLCSSLKDLKKRSFKTYSYSQELFEKVSHNRFRLFFDRESKDFVERMEASPSLPLGELVDIYSGCIGRYGKNSIVSHRKKSVVTIKNRKGKVVYFDDNASNKWCPLLASGKEISKYFINYGGNFVLFDEDPKRRRIYAKSGFNEEKYKGEKLFLRQTGDSLIAAYDQEGYFCLNNMHVINLLKDVKDYDLKYILAILNSELMKRYYHLITLEFKRPLAQTDIETVLELPIRKINFKNLKEKEKHATIVNLVENILTLKKQKNTKKGKKSAETKKIEEKIKNIDKKINLLINQLYLE
ncbi:MAG: Eco57I restriction-modification methylase domain-containing protein [Candidatus Hodarchaeota archaeon]